MALTTRRLLPQSMDLVMSPPPFSLLNHGNTEDEGGSTFNPLTAIVVLFLLIILFLLRFLFVYKSLCFIISCQPYHPNTTSHHNEEEEEEEEEGENNAMRTTSPSAWSVHSQILESLPKVMVSSSHQQEGVLKQSKCVICLEELMGEDTVRLLPQCAHMFHEGCILMWLYTHKTCPLCRHTHNLANAPKQHFPSQEMPTESITIQVKDALNPVQGEPSTASTE